MESADNRSTLENFPILLTVGSISIRKGHYNVIKLLPHIIKEYPLTHYHCVGNYNDKENLLKLIRQLKLNDFVTLHGILNILNWKKCIDSPILIWCSQIIIIILILKVLV